MKINGIYNTTEIILSVYRKNTKPQKEVKPIVDNSAVKVTISSEAKKLNELYRKNQLEKLVWFI